MQGDDFYSGAAISGAASGAAAGGSIGGPWGAAIGGIGGGLVGAFSNSKRDDATAQQSKAMDQIMANMRAMGQSTYDQHIQDLQKALAFYGPAQKAWDRLYSPGTGAAATGQGSWAGTGVTGAK